MKKNLYLVSLMLIASISGVQAQEDLSLQRGWNCSVKTVTDENDPEVSYEQYSFGQWGSLGHTFSPSVTLDEGDVHRFVVKSSVPFTGGVFQWKVTPTDDSDASYYASFEEGETEAVLEIKSDNEKVPFYTTVAIQCMNSGTLPIDVTMTREIIYGNGAIVREELPIAVGGWGGKAELIDPDPAEDTAENGLPCRLNLPGSWGAENIWIGSFNAAEYPMYKIVLRERPENLQMFYRTASHGDSGAVYVPWETSDDFLCELSEDGTTLTGEFDIDALEGDNEILHFCLQNTGGSAISCIVEAVYLYDEDEKEIPTAGLNSSGIWNGGSTTPLGGSYDENGNLWDAKIALGKGSWLGTWSASDLAEGHYHHYTFFTEEPLPDGLTASANKDFDWNTFESTPVTTIVKGQGSKALTVDVYGRYDTFFLSWNGEDDLNARVTKIRRELMVGDDPGTSSVQEAETCAAVVATEYFTTSGMRVDRPAKGVTIVRKVMSDGTVSVSKQVIK